MNELNFEISTQETRDNQDFSHEFAFNDQVKKDLSGELDINFLDDLDILEIV